MVRSSDGQLHLQLPGLAYSLCGRAIAAPPEPMPVGHRFHAYCPQCWTHHLGVPLETPWRSVSSAAHHAATIGADRASVAALEWAAERVGAEVLRQLLVFQQPEPQPGQRLVHCQACGAPSAVAADATQLEHCHVCGSDCPLPPAAVG